MPTTRSYFPLKTRSTPKQERARQRVGQILAAAEVVLADHAPNEVSSTLIAGHAGVPVSSIYRYFPTVPELAEELYMHAASALKESIFSALEQPGDWRARAKSALELLRGFLLDHPYYRPLLVFIEAHRGPQTLDHDFNHEIVAMLAARWRQGGDGFSGASPETVATTVIQILLSLEELLIRQTDPEREAQYFAEMHRVVTSYLSLYLRDPDGEDRT